MLVQLLGCGLLHLQFGDDVMVFVESPARFDAVSSSRVVLHSGRLSASVADAGVGFTVETPEADVIEFGTDFSVEVDSDSSEVHVFDGLVRVQPKAAKDGDLAEAIDLRKWQAIKFEHPTDKPVDIKIAKDRFIRNFDEPKRTYSRTVKRMSPLVYYRMPIRDRGLVSDPPQYSGEVLVGDGIRPPHARGVFAGGALRVGADSTGRGGRIDSPPALTSGEFTLAVFIYRETQRETGTLVTNLGAGEGNLRLAFDGTGRMQATVKESSGQLQSVVSDNPVPLKTWRHVVVTLDGVDLRIYEEGALVASNR